jgi:Flp pilus assembly protein TadD
MSYRLLLLSAQLADNRLADALVTATEAAKLDPSDYVPLVWRAYIQRRIGRDQANILPVSVRPATRQSCAGICRL